MPTTPTDSDSTTNLVRARAPADTRVGLTAFSSDPDGSPITYSLAGDTSGGGFKIDPNTGVVSIADPGKITFENSWSGSGAFYIFVQASDGRSSNGLSFRIDLAPDLAPTTPTDSDAAANRVAEHAPADTPVGLTVSSSDPEGGRLTYSLLGDTTEGGFKIDPNTGVVSVADPSKISVANSWAGSGAFYVYAQASDGHSGTALTFRIDTDLAPTTPTDSDAAANRVAEHAAADTPVGLTVSSSDPEGGRLTYSLLGDTTEGGFKIDPNTGVVSVADPSKISVANSWAGSGAFYVYAQASDGHSGTALTFRIDTDLAPTIPTDSNAALNLVAERAAADTPVGLTVSSSDPEGAPLTYSITGDTSEGGFKIDPNTGVVSIADPSKITLANSWSGSGAFYIYVQASDGHSSSGLCFRIDLKPDLAPATPTDSDPAVNFVADHAAAGTTVGLTVSSSDPEGGPITYSLLGDTSEGGFRIDPDTGVVSVADPSKITLANSWAGSGAFYVYAQASDGHSGTALTFRIDLNNAPTTPVDSNGTGNFVVEGAAADTPVGLTASSSDPEGSAVTYSLIGDSSGGGFKINPSTGVVSVADPTKINYETAAGHAYAVTVQASDGIATSSQAFSIDVGDRAPSVPKDVNGAPDTIAEGAANGSPVGITASSTDVNGPAVSWSLTSDTSGGGFTINSTTGVITVADATKINYETAAHTYSVTAQASDGTLTASRAFTIAVTDVAPSTPIDVNGAPDTIAEGAASGSAVGITASSTDVNGPAVSWSLTSDSSGGGFAINSATGVITVANAAKIDYESAAGHAYSVTAQASDGTLTASRAFTIAVTDVAPSTPIDVNGAPDTIAEGAASGSAVGITASSTDVNGPAVSWSLTSDSSGGGFAINSATGVITVANAAKIDYESAAGHAYSVTAQASDGTLTASRAFTIAVTDVAPSTPIDVNGAPDTIAEGAASGSAVGITASSTDVNGPAVSWSLTSDSSGGGFTIDPATGVITVADATKIDYESAAGHAYAVTATASDGTLTSSKAFSIAVTDVAIAAPTDVDPAANSVAEGASNGSTVGLTASAIDPNGPATVYSLTNSAGGRFAINSSTGVVTVANGALLDFETATSHSITVQAVAAGQTTTQSFTINVTDVNDNAPIFSSGTTGGEAENTPTPNVVYTAHASDADGTPANNTVTYSLSSGGDNDLFTIDGGSGEVRFRPPPGQPPDYENPADADHNNVYQITVHAIDNNGVHDVTRNVAITITDVNDNAPVFSSATTATTAENVATSTAVYTAHANDADGTAANNTVTYSLGGTDAGLFDFDSTTGQVKFHASPNFEAPADAGGDNVYDITVTASDGLAAHDVTQSVAITVTDVNDNTPAFTSGTTASENENTAASNVVYKAVATDADGTAPNNTVSFSLAAHVAGADDNDLFSIDSVTGDVRFLNSPDFENAADFNHDNSYVLKVTATDGGTPAKSATQTVTISVGDLNDNAPVFATPATTDTTPENNASYSFDAHATDLDGTSPNNQIAYSLTGEDASQFNISNAGVLTFKTTPDFEAPTDLNLDNIYKVTVHAIDGNGAGPHDTARDLQITVTDAPDVPPAFTSGSTGSEAEGTAASNVVYTATTAPSAGVTFSLTSGLNDNNFFDIDPTTGNLTFKVSPNFETQAAYLVTVQANAAGFHPTKNVNISVTDVAPTAPADATGSINEGQGVIGGAVSTGIELASTDPGGDTVNFSLSNSAGGRFAIDSSDPAHIKIVTGPNASLINYETSGATHSYTVTVVASTTSGTATTSKSYKIDVGDVAPLDPAADLDPNTPDKDASANGISINAANGTQVGVTAFLNDPDGGPLTYAFAGGSLLDPAGRFAIDATTGIITLADKTLLGPIGTAYNVQVQASDGVFTTTSQNISITVTSDTPIVDLDTGVAGTGFSDTFTEGDAAHAISNANIGITDAASAQLVSATVTLTNAKAGDSLVGASVFGITASAPVFDAGAGTITITLTGTDTLAHYQTAIHDIVFNNTSQNPDTADRVINVQVNDGTNNSNVAQATISVVAVNDAPVLSGGPFPGISFTENGGDQALFGGASIADNDSPANFDTGTLTISSSQAGDQIVLSSATYALGGSVPGGLDLLRSGVSVGTIHNAGTSTVTITFNDHATLSVVNELAQAFAYRNTQDAPAGGAHTISLQFNDGGHSGTGSGDSNTLTQTVTVTPVNDAPFGTDHTATTAEDTPYVFTTSDFGFSDVDGTFASVKFTSVPGAGTLKNGATVLATNDSVSVGDIGAGNVQFFPAADANGSPYSSFQFKVVDNNGAPAASANTMTLNVTAVNDAPVLTANAPTLTSITEDDNSNPGQLVSSFVGAAAPKTTISDVDAGAVQGIAITGADSGFHGDWEYSLNGSTWTSIGTVSSSSALLLRPTDHIRFVPDGKDGSAPTLTYVAWDQSNTSQHAGDKVDPGVGGGTSPFSTTSDTASLTVTAINDAPVNHVPLTAQVTPTGTDITFSPFSIPDNGISISDVDVNGNAETVTLTVAHGTLDLAAGFTGLTFAPGGGDGTGDATMTFSGTLSDINNALDGLIYHPDAGYTGPDTLTITTNDQGNSPSGALSDTDTVDINVTATAPTGLDGQLWYVTRDLSPHTDDVVGHVNSDGSGLVLQNTAPDTGDDLGIDTAAGLYFVIDSATKSLVSHVMADGSTASTQPPGGDTFTALAIDPVNHLVYVGVTCTTPNDTGIAIFTYDPNPFLADGVTPNPGYGALGNTGQFLLTQASTTDAGAGFPNGQYTNATDFTIDLANQKLYYVDDDATTANGIYVVDIPAFDSGAPSGTVEINTAAATLLTDPAAFPANGSNGFIVAAAVDVAHHLVYFLTDDPANGNAGKLWYVDTTDPTHTANPVTDDAATPAQITVTGESFNTGLTFDPGLGDLFISNQGGQAILQGHVDPVTHKIASFSHTFTSDALTGGTGSTAVPGATTLDIIPALSVTSAATHAAEQGAAVTLLAGQPTITDPDGGFLASATVRITGGAFSAGETSAADDHLDFAAADVTANLVNGTNIRFAYDSANETLTLIGYDTIANYKTALAKVQYSTTGDNATNDDLNTTRTITWTVSDGAPNIPAGAQNSGTTTVTIDPTNDAPVATITPASYSATERTTLVLKGNGLSVSDPDSLSTGVTVTLSVTEGTLDVTAGGSGVVVSNSGTSAVTLDGTIAQINALLNTDGSSTFTYIDNTDTPSATATLTLSIDDNGHTGPGLHPAVSDTATINITAINSAPVVTTSNGATSASEQIATAIDSGLTVTDADSPKLDHATISITGNYQAGEDVLTFVNDGSTMGDIDVQSNAGGVLTLHSTTGATPGAWQAALRAVTYTDSSDTPSTAARTITFVANDGTSDSTMATKTVTVTAVNDAPTLDLNTAVAGNDFADTYTATAAPIAITATVGITDPDSSGISSAKVVLTDPQAGDVLSILGALPAGISASFSNANHTIDLAGTASRAAYQTALHQIQFSTTGSDGDRHIAIFVKDDFVTPASSATATSTITVAANTAPTAVADTVTRTELGGVNNAGSTADPDGSDPVSGNVLTNDTDAPAPKNLTVVSFGTLGVGQPDNGTLGTALLGIYGTLTLNADGSFTYAVDNSLAATQALRSTDHPTDLFHYTAQDAGGLQSSTTFTATVNGAEDKPLAVTDLGSMGEDSAATSFEVRANDSLDPDAGATNAIAAGAHPGSITGPAGTTFVTTDADTVVSGTAIQVTLGAAFQQLRNGETATIDVPYTLTGNNDGGGDPSTGHLFVTVNGADDFPLAADDSPAAITEDNTTTTYSVLTNDTLDPDHGALNTIATGAVTVSSPLGAAVLDSSDVGLTTPGGNTQIQVTLGADFQRLQVGQHADVTIHYALQGNAGELSGADLHLTVNGLNDAPVVTPGVAGSFTENSAAQTVAPSLTITDVDNATLSAAVVDLTNAKTDDSLTLSGQAGTSGTLNSGADAIDWTIDTATAGHIKVNFAAHAGANPTVADFQSAIHLVQFSNSDDNLDATTRTFTVTATDTADGTPANDLTGSSGSFNFAVTAVNDAPVNTVASPAPASHFYASANTNFTISGFQIADADANPDNVQVTLGLNHGGAITVASVAGGAPTITGNGTSTVVLTGTVAQINTTLANGGSGITYKSAAAFNGLDATPGNNIETLQITTNDLGHNPGPALTDQDSVQIGVLPKVWYIDDAAPASPSGPLGSHDNPFVGIAAFNAVNDGGAGHPAAGDTVFLYSGSYTTGITLLDNQKLIGQGDGLAVQDPFAAAGTNLQLVASGARPVISVGGTAIGIDLASGNNVHGLDVATTAAGAVGIDDGAANNSVGSLSISNMQITGTGKAVDIDHGGALNVTLDKLTSTGSTTEGVDLDGVSGGTAITGSFTVNNTGGASAISGAGATAFNVTQAGSLNITYKGDITQASNAALVNIAGGTGGHTGTVTFQNGTLSATNGTGLQFDNADGTYNFGKSADSSTVTLNGGNAGIDILNGSGGTFTFGSNTAITNPSGAAFNLNSGNATVDYSGGITANNGRAVVIDGHTGNTIQFDNGNISGNGAGASGILVQNDTGGTVNFNNPSITLSTQGNNGVTLLNNSGGTVNFDSGGSGNGLDITTTSGVGFSANGATGSTVNVKDYAGAITSNTINSTNGTALNITNTTIGANNVTFRSISSGNNDAGADPVNGIVLNNTGATGHLTITGDAGSTNNSSGGTIQHTTGAGILLTSTRDVSLDQMNIQSTGGSGIDGTGVTNFTITNSTINNSGDGVGGSDATLESNIGFNHSASGNGLGNNISGTLTITGNTLTNAYFSGVDLEGSAGTITNANVSSNTITSTTSQATSKGSGILVNATGDASGAMSIDQATINNNNVTGFPSGSGIIVSGGNASASGVAGHLGLFNDNTKVIEIASNQVQGFSQANEMASFGIAAVLTGGNSGSRAQGNFNIHNNGTVANPVKNMLGQAIQVGNNGFSDMRIHTDNNVLAPHNINASQGIGGGNGVAGAGSAWTPHLIWSIDGNTISDTDGNGILAVGRQTSGTMDLEVLNNTVATPTSSTTLARRTVEIEAGNAVSTDDAIHLSISGNTVGAGLNGAGAIGLRKQGNVSTVNDFGIFDTAADDATPGHVLANNPTNAQVQAFVQALNPGAAGVDVLQGPGFIRDTTHVSPLMAAAGGIAGSSPGESHLTQAQLDSIVAAAIGQWAQAGASANQLAALHATHYVVGDLSGAVVGEQSTGQITIDVDAAGHGWFVDPTPNDNSEFAHAANAAGTDLYTDPSSAAAGHLDLLTTVAHEMGHVLGLDDSTSQSDAHDLMYIDLVDGERRLPDAADVVQASAAASAEAAEAAVPVSAQAAAGTPIVAGTAANDSINAGHGGNILAGGGGADTFVFGPDIQLSAATPAQVTHVADYSAAQGDSFDFSALTSAFHNSNVSDSLVVRAVEDASGKFATLQVDHIDPMGLPAAPNWVNVAQLDGAHAGDAVNVWIDNNHSVHLAQIHVDLLV